MSGKISLFENIKMRNLLYSIFLLYRFFRKFIKIQGFLGGKNTWMKSKTASDTWAFLIKKPLFYKDILILIYIKNQRIPVYKFSRLYARGSPKGYQIVNPGIWFVAVNHNLEE